MGFLFFLGKRRPTHLGETEMYQETVSRPKAQPVKHKNPKNVQGTRLGKANRQADKR